MNAKGQAALALYHQWFGERAFALCGLPGPSPKQGVTRCSGCGAKGGHLHSGATHAFCDVCVTVAGNYQGIGTPGRMGGGWAALITPAFAELTTTSEKNLQAFKTLPQANLAHATPNELIMKALLNPPEPPFMLIRFGNANADICGQLRASYSKDLIYLSGDTIDRIDARKVRDGVAAVTRAEIPQKLLQQSVASYSAIARGLLPEAGLQKARQTICDAEVKLPGITEIIRSMPLIGSSEYKWIMACSYATK
jgi:hypothetical protein